MEKTDEPDDPFALGSGKPGDKQIVDDVVVMPPQPIGPAGGPDNASINPDINLPPIMPPVREPSGDGDEFDFNN